MAVVAAVAMPAAGIAAQEVEPRTYVNTPVDLNFLAVGYNLQRGNVLFDSALPLDDVHADLHIAFVRYLRTLAIAGKPAKFAVALPLLSGHWEGLLDDEFRTRDANGLGDLRVGLEVLLWGATPRRLGDPPAPNERTIVGAGFALVVPTGQYDSERLINLGSNRWSMRSQVGMSHAFGNWTVEGMAAVWLFSDNDDFFGGSQLTQEHLSVVKSDIVYSFNPGIWLGIGVGYGEGATTRIDGNIRNTLQTNWRFGGTFAVAVAPRHGISVTVMSGVTTRVGADFDSFGAVYQYQWGGR